MHRLCSLSSKTHGLLFTKLPNVQALVRFKMVLSLCVNADLGTSADKAGGGGVYKADIVVQGQRSYFLYKKNHWIQSNNGRLWRGQSVPDKCRFLYI